MNEIVNFSARYLFIVVVFLEVVFLVLRHRRRWRELIIAAAIIGAVAFFASLVVNRFIQDPRPFVVGRFTPMIPSSTDNGFPSDHVLLLAATAAVTMVASLGAGLLGLLGAVLVGLARVCLGVHHLADVAGSVVIVGIAGGVYAIVVGVWKRFVRSDERR